jgi:hypothetical protein
MGNPIPSRRICEHSTLQWGEGLPILGATLLQSVFEF